MYVSYMAFNAYIVKVFNKEVPEILSFIFKATKYAIK